MMQYYIDGVGNVDIKAMDNHENDDALYFVRKGDLGLKVRIESGDYLEKKSVHGSILYEPTLITVVNRPVLLKKLSEKIVTAFREYANNPPKG